MKAFFAAAVALGLTGLAAAGGVQKPIVLTVDARQDCMGLADGTRGQVSAMLPSGQYRVSVESSASYCVDGCSVDKVAFYITTDDQPKGWFYVVAVGEPISVTVSDVGFEANKVRAFFVDALCSDNAGRAVLTFRRR